MHAAETLPLPESTGAAEHASTSVETGAITLSWWERVHEALASGLGGCLGEDWWGRRLHILGGKMGAHRVYVENPNTGSWGWYDSKSWGALLLWLRSAGIQGEEGLVKKLALLVGKHEAFVREAAARGGEPSGVEREDGEGDGYAGVVAPLLWGGADIRGGRLVSAECVFCVHETDSWQISANPRPLGVAKSHSCSLRHSS